MGKLSTFFGIYILMRYNDHNPPHFHVVYAEHEASYAIRTLEVLNGNLPSRAHAMVMEWASLHRDELYDNWLRARNGQELTDIDPLR